MLISLLVLTLALQAAGDPATEGAAPPPPTVASPVPTPAPAPPAAAPASAPAPVPPPAAPPPRRLDDLSRPLTGMVPQGSYEAGVRDAFSRTQSRQGPLDGTWTLKDADGAGLYRFQLVDGGGDALQGAWADLQGASPANGFLTIATRTGAHLVLQFVEKGVGFGEASLDGRPDGSLAGELSITGAGKPVRKTAVTLTR